MDTAGSLDRRMRPNRTSPGSTTLAPPGPSLKVLGVIRPEGRIGAIEGVAPNAWVWLPVSSAAVSGAGGLRDSLIRGARTRHNWSEGAPRKIALLRNNSLYARGLEGAVRVTTPWSWKYGLPV